MVRRAFYQIIFWVLLLGALSSCKRANESGISTVSFQLPVAATVVQAHHALMSQSVSNWNAGLTPTNINEINCYVVMVETPEVGAPNICYDSSSNPLFGFHMAVGGVAASGQTLQLEVPTGSKRRFLIVGLKADSSNLATGCHDFKAMGIDKSLFSQPLLIGSQTADILDETVPLNITTSLTNAKNLNNCTGFVDLTPAPTLAINGLGVTPAGPAKVVSPDIIGNITGSFPIQLSLHGSPGCADSVYTSNTNLAAGPSFNLSLAPSLSASSTYNLYVKATDGSGSTACAGPISYVFDNIAPALTISVSSITAATPPTFSGTCETGLNVSMSGDDTGNVMCSGGSWSLPVAAKAADATYNYTFAQTDAAGNISSQAGSWTRNTAGPSFTITSATAFNSPSAPTFSGTCTNGLAVDISGTDNTTASCAASAWSYTVAGQPDGNYSYTFSQTSAGVTTSATGTWVRDSTPPSATSFSITEGGAVTAPLIHLNFQATDATQVAAYCVRLVTTAPTFTDSCWKPLSGPGPNPNVINEPYLLPLTPGAYNLFLFLADSGGNISSLTAGGAGTDAIDKKSTSYNPDPIPVLSKLLVSNSDSMYAATAELNIPSGNPLYIRWNATGSIAGNGIALVYTTDDLTWSLLASGLTNGSNSCTPNGPGTADDDATGCYVGISPTSSFFRVKIDATTANGFKGGMYSESLNASSYRELAGRPGSGLGFDSSLLTINAVPFGGSQADTDALAVDSSGIVYVRDQKLGVIKIDPVTRTSSIFVRTTGTSTGDGGAFSSATLKHPFKIGVDGQDNLYIYDEARIRVVNKATGLINTLVGGGADPSLVSKPATNLQIQFNSSIYSMSDSYMQAMPFIVLSNGDVIFEDKYRNAFSASTQNYFWYYDHTNGNVFPQILSGTGYAGNASENISLCNAYRLAAEYNPVTGTIASYIGTLAMSGAACAASADAVRLDTNYTSAAPIPPTFPGGNSSYFNLVTGLDGKIYGLNAINGTIYRFSTTSNTWTTLAGTGSLGTCADGMAALSCSLTATNVTVNSRGQVYFVDNGKIRMIHPDGTIRTVFGYGSAAGDGGPGLLAQFGELMDLGFWYNGSRKVVLYDKANLNLREVNLSSNIVTRIAGNGTTTAANSGSPGLSTGLGNINWEKTFAINPSSGDVFWKNLSGGGQLVRLDRGTGNWITVVGGGGSDYFTAADGLAGLTVNFASGFFQPILYANGYLWSHASSSSHLNVAVKSYDSAASYTQSNYLSLAGANSSSCPSFQATCGTLFPANGSLRVSYNSMSANLLFVLSSSNTIKYGNAGNISTFTTTTNPISAFAYHYNGNEYIYYCSSTGTLFKRDVTGNSETPIPLPTNAKCASTKLEVDGGANILYFVSEKNGVFGLASVPL